MSYIIAVRFKKFLKTFINSFEYKHINRHIKDTTIVVVATITDDNIYDVYILILETGSVCVKYDSSL